MLTELSTHEFTTFIQTLRAPKDEYAKRKVQKDRMKLKELLDGLLRNREVILFYRENGEEKYVIGTTRKYVEAEVWPELPDVPMSVEIINNQEVEEMHYCRFWSFPDRTPLAIHLDNVTKFIVSKEGLNYNFFQEIKHGKR